MMEIPEAPYRRSTDDVLAALDVRTGNGLSEPEVKHRRERFGPNRLAAAKRRSAWRILLDQFESLVVILLLAAAAAAAVLTQFVEAVAIAAAVIINTVIGFGTEYAATRSMDALRRMGRTTARVRRDGQLREISADDLVPGDIVALAEGEVVPADLRVVESENLQCNEAPLTGESEPVSKDSGKVEREAPLAERSNMAFKGTAVSRGAGEGVAVATGNSTEIGRISELVQEAESEGTPFEKRLERLGRRLIFLVIAVGLGVGVSGILAGQETVIMIETAIVLAIAAVPEGLPVVATIALGRGMWRMAKRNALVRKLSAVETLGATTVILTDKTGTLTENRMAVNRIAMASGDIRLAPGDGNGFSEGDASIDPGERADLKAVLLAGALCSNAELDDRGDAGRGDPMEVALLQAARAAGATREELLRDFPEEREESFDVATKMMATFHRRGEGYLVAVKGAPEAVLDATTTIRRNTDDIELTDDERGKWLRRNEELANDGLRVLALAEKRADSVDADPYDGLTLLGLVGFYDPPRKGIGDSLAACRAAGIRVVMVTGDQAATALNVAREVGVVDEDGEAAVAEGAEMHDLGRQRIRSIRVFARVSPEHKLRIVESFQAAGDIVAMTGDGVNDAPALKKADIGIAMGRRGTEVAREAADIVLKDDAFESIVMAVRQGRTIFSNIRKFVIFLLSGNLGQIFIVSLAALSGAPLPLLPLQILFLNLLLDVFPALALSVSRDEPQIMQQPPRDPEEAILTNRQWLAIGGFAVLIAGAVLAAFAWAVLGLGQDGTSAVTVSFLAYGFARIWHIFNMRSPSAHPMDNNIVRNPYVWGAILLCGGLLLAVVYVPPAAELLRLRAPDASLWGLVVAASLAPLLLGQLAITVIARRSHGTKARGDRSRNHSA